MSNQEIGQTGTEERPVEQPQETEIPRPTTPLPPEQPVRQAAEQPSPPQYPPYRPGYYPGPGPQPAYRPYYGQPYYGPPPYAPPPRRHRAWPWILLAVVLVLVFTWIVSMVFAGIGFNFMGYTSTVTETPRHFAVSTTPTVVINSDIGSIHVQSGGTGSDVTIQATKHAGFGNNVNDVQVNYSQDSGANTITVNVERTSAASFLNSPSVDFQVTVPSNTALELKANTGSIDVSGVSGQMSLRSNTGSVTVTDGGLTSSSTLESNTGSITFHGSIARTGSYQFRTNTGSVNVTLPANSVFHVDAATDTGSISSNFSGVSVQHPNFTGAVVNSDVGSSPQATITLRTNTGSINLYQS